MIVPAQARRGLGHLELEIGLFEIDERSLDGSTLLVDLFGRVPLGLQGFEEPFEELGRSDPVDAKDVGGLGVGRHLFWIGLAARLTLP